MNLLSHSESILPRIPSIFFEKCWGYSQSITKGLVILKREVTTLHFINNLQFSSSEALALLDKGFSWSYISSSIACSCLFDILPLCTLERLCHFSKTSASIYLLPFNLVKTSARCLSISYEIVHILIWLEDFRFTISSLWKLSYPMKSSGYNILNNTVEYFTGVQNVTWYNGT